MTVMTDFNVSLNESIEELRKLIQLMDDDAKNLTMEQAVSDYIAPILDSMLSEIAVNRQYTVQTNDRVSLALMMAEKTFLGDILTSIAEHFSTIVDELPEDTDSDSKIGVAVMEVQDLLATWMSFDLSDEDEGDEGDEDDGDEDDGDEEDSGDTIDVTPIAAAVEGEATNAEEIIDVEP